jgi:hypothetical protein
MLGTAGLARRPQLCDDPRYMAKRTVKAPDGREWQVRTQRVRSGAWHPVFVGHGDRAVSAKTSLVLVLVGGLLIPLVLLIVALPFKLLLSLISPNRWVLAVTTGSPSERLMWKTRRARQQGVFDEVAQGLEQGQSPPAPEGAELRR